MPPVHIAHLIAAGEVDPKPPYHAYERAPADNTEEADAIAVAEGLSAPRVVAQPTLEELGISEALPPDQLLTREAKRNYSRCTATSCTAGTNHSGCSHVLAATYCLVKLQARTIKAGDIGDGEKAWGFARTDSTVPAKHKRHMPPDWLYTVRLIITHDLAAHRHTHAYTVG